MKKIIIFLSTLLTTFHTQSMETPTLTLDLSVIKQLRTDSKKNKSDPSLFSRRTRRLNLLEQLLNGKTEINFSNNNDTIIFWLNKNNNCLVQEILYEKLLSFISYNPSQHTVKIQHIPFSEKKSFNATLQFNDSLLYLTIAHSLTDELRKIISKFLDQYNSHECHYYAQYSIPIQKQNIQLPQEEKYDETTLFTKLPDNTQKLLLEILDDMDNIASQQGVQ